jgi:putative transposase
MANAMVEGAEDKGWDLARQREVAIRALADLPIVSGAKLADAARQMGISTSRASALLGEYRGKPETATLKPRKPGPQLGSFRLDPRVETIIANAIDEFYAKAEKPKLSKLRREINHRCIALKEDTDSQNTGGGLRTPSRKAIRARIVARDQKALISAREGTKAAEDKFLPAIHSYNSEFALQIMQADHARVDLIVVDDVYRQPLGRPWVTFVIDIASRTIHGFYLTLEDPSIVSIGLMMRHAVLPKQQWLSARGVSAPWANEGLPDQIDWDNAKAHHARAFLEGCRTYGIRPNFRPVRRPHFGGHIERLIGMMMGEVYLLPGTTFSNVSERGSYDSEKNATMTLDELATWLAIQIVGPYHNGIHRGIGVPPYLAWQDALERRPASIRLPLDPQKFLFDFLPLARRKVRREGIELFNTFYWDGVLEHFVRHGGPRMPIRWDPRDMSCIWLATPDGAHWPIHTRDLRRPKVTRWEQIQAQTALRVRGIAAVNEELIFQAIKAQRHLLLESVHKTKVARLQLQRTTNALRGADADHFQIHPAQSTLPPPVDTEIVVNRSKGSLPFEVEEFGQ